MTVAAKPTLVVVSGPPGSGKTTLAHELAAAIGCPAICRDEIKEGMAHGVNGYEPGPDDPLPWQTFEVFFDVLELLARAGVTVVAEAAFQDQLWRRGLERVTPFANVRIVHCAVNGDNAYERRLARAVADPARRAVHETPGQTPDRETAMRGHEAFVRLSLDVPRIEVDTTDGYEPGLAVVAAWVSETVLD
jgi:predicted kinase